MRAKDIMTETIVAVTETTPVHEIVGLLLKHRISGVPVVDGDQRVLGIISEGDLLRPIGRSRDSADRPWWLEAVYSGGRLAFERERERAAGDVMTRDVAVVDVETPLGDVAELLERRHIKRVPVLQDGRLVGIVSRANLLHGLATTIIDAYEPGAAADRSIRADILNAIETDPSLRSVLINVTVRDGAVKLWGVVENEAEMAAAERHAKAAAGVKSVRNNLGLPPASGVPV